VEIPVCEGRKNIGKYTGTAISNSLKAGKEDRFRISR
jgi:hypothetical protein